jgi:hypothetical protein
MAKILGAIGPAPLPKSRQRGTALLRSSDEVALDTGSRQEAAGTAGRRAQRFQIARLLRTTRSAVIGRSKRLRGIVYQSDIDSWNRANAKRTEEARKRTQLRREKQRKAMRAMSKDLARGMPERKAMARAHIAGATWSQIGNHFGISQQAAYERAREWTRRLRR